MADAKKFTSAEKGNVKIAILTLQIALGAPSRDEQVTGVLNAIKTLRGVVPPISSEAAADKKG